MLYKLEMSLLIARTKKIIIKTIFIMNEFNGENKCQD
jgi:hypothetical protein